MEIAARPVEEDSKPDQGCPIQDHTHHIAIKWLKFDFESGLAQTQHPLAVGIPVLETLLKLQIATLMVCLFISSTSFTSAEYLIIGPESDHWECLSLTESLTHSCLVNLNDMTLACEDDNSKLVEIVTVTHFDDEKRVDNSLVQIWKVKFGLKVKFLFRL